MAKLKIEIALQPKQRLFAETIEEKPITFYGGAKGGGKSKGLQLIMLLRRFKYPGSHGAIFRRTYPELEGNHIRPLFESYPHLREFWNESKKLLSLPNGSTLQFCHCKNETDVDLYQGREFHDLAIDEAGQWTESMFRKLQGSNRSSKPGIKPRIILTGNPGGIGHGWLKRLFIDKRYNLRETPSDYSFIQALVDDNKALLENDQNYIKVLESMPNEALRKAYRFGDWDIFAGQFFTELSRSVHFIEPFPIPPHWNRFGSYDFGFNHPGSFGWYAVDEDGNVYKYRELVKSQWRVDQWAREINKYEDSAQLYPIVAGADCWVTKNVLKTSIQPTTVADEFKEHGILLKKAVTDRIQGAAHLRTYLAWQKKQKDQNGNMIDGKPRLFIFNTCPITYETLSRMIFDPDRPEDVLKVDAVEGDTNSGDDTYDETRYGLMSRPSITEAQKEVYPWGSPEWARQQASEMEERAEEHFKKQYNLDN